MAARAEMLRDGTIGREETLGVARGFKPLHPPLPLAGGLVGVLRPIIQIALLPMCHPRKELSLCSPITLQFVSNDHARHVLQPFEPFPKESLGGLCVALALHQDIKHGAILIHCSPQIVPLATDSEEDLVHMPFVATARATTTQFVGVGLPEFEAPLPNRFRGHDNPALCQKFFDRTEN